MASFRHGADRLLLDLEQPVDAVLAEVDEAVHLLPRERLALGRALHLDQLTLAGHDDVEVDLGAGVLLVAEVEQQLAVDVPGADRPDTTRDRVRAQAVAAA